MVFYWDTVIYGHHSDYIRLTASALINSIDALVISSEVASGLETSIVEKLLGENRLFILPAHRHSALGWREFFRLRSFIKSLPQPVAANACIVHLEVSEMHLLFGLFSMLPWERGWVSRVTGIYFKSKSLFERSLGLKYRLKGWIIHSLVDRWISALKPGIKMGFLTLAMYRRYAGNPKFSSRTSYIPDPVPSYLEALHSDTASAPETRDREAITLCLVGVHAPRKGTDFAVKSLLSLYRGERPLRCIVAGPLDGCPEIRIMDLKSNPRVEIILDDRNIPGTEFGEIIRGSDICLLPYARHFSPSAVLLVAAYWGTPVLASDIGQVADEVRQYDLGRLFSTNDASSFVDSLDLMIHGESRVKRVDPEKRSRYLEEHSRTTFQTSLLDLAAEFGKSADSRLRLSPQC